MSDTSDSSKKSEKLDEKELDNVSGGLRIISKEQYHMEQKEKRKRQAVEEGKMKYRELKRKSDEYMKRHRC